MDRDINMLTALLLDPCLTTDEAEREAAAFWTRPTTATPRERRTRRASSTPPVASVAPLDPPSTPA